MDVGDRVYLIKELEQQLDAIATFHDITAKKIFTTEYGNGYNRVEYQFQLDCREWVSEKDLIAPDNAISYVKWLCNRQILNMRDAFIYTDSRNESHTIHPHNKEAYEILDNTLVKVKRNFYDDDPEYTEISGWVLIYYYNYYSPLPCYTSYFIKYMSEKSEVIQGAAYENKKSTGYIFKNWLLSQTKDCSWEDFMKYSIYKSLDFQEKD